MTHTIPVIIPDDFKVNFYILDYLEPNTKIFKSEHGVTRINKQYK